MQYYLGIDAGGTHCRCRIIDETGKKIGEGETGPANTRIGTEKLYETLMGAVNQALQQAKLTQENIAQIKAGFGIAGISRQGSKEALLAKEFPFSKIKVTSDADIANLGANEGKDGAVLIIGTGSVAFVKLGDNRFTIGGYGFPISDEGSGAALGLSAMRHALRALDGRSKTTPLSNAINQHFHFETAKAIEWMDSASPKDYGGFAPLVMDYAENGDEIALSIVNDAVLHIEKFIETIFTKGAPRLSMLGGLAKRIKPWLRARTITKLSEPKGDALDGALWLAGYRAK